MDIARVNGVRQSCKIAALVMERISHSVVEGATTYDIEKVAAEAMNELKVRSAFLGYHNFPGSICVSVNEEVLHGIPSRSKRIYGGDIVKVDMGVVCDGFYSDMAATFLIDDCSEISVSNRMLMSANLSALMAGINIVRSGIHVQDISAAIETSLKSKGYEAVDNMCGHGVGAKLHELPSIPNKVNGCDPNPFLTSGMTIAIEPMVGMGTTKVRVKNDGWTLVTDNGKNSSHFEHTVLVTDDGYEILTKL